MTLDPLSTSQKTVHQNASDSLENEIAYQIEQSYNCQAERCENHAPFIAYRAATGKWHLAQGCCNSWTCSRCGQIRAREEYGRMVEGVKELHKGHSLLFFVTITMRGKELDLNTADDDYLKLTNRLFSAWRARAKKQGDVWAYVQVTERQRRGAAHSHIICASYPNDAKEYKRGDVLPNGATAKHDCIFSVWFMGKCVAAGLGKMTDCTIIRSPIGAAVYVAKYLFKDAQTVLWPKGLSLIHI